MNFKGSPQQNLYCKSYEVIELQIKKELKIVLVVAKLLYIHGVLGRTPKFKN